jgi:hypothetical protein
MNASVRLRFVTGVIGFALAVGCVVAQNAPAGSAPHEIIANGSLIHTLLAAPVIGQPYSAMQVHSTVRKLADGTTISHKGQHFVARDAEGRVRVEFNLVRGLNGEPNTVLVSVVDPVTHTVTSWVTGPKVQKVATVAKVPEQRMQQASIQPEGARTSTRPQPVVKIEDLGVQTIQGLPVTDVRTTTVLPVGRSGNDAPITKTREVWTSQDLKLVMKEQWEDPRSGERTIALESFSRVEPDPALFQPPAGYVVKTVAQSLKALEEKLSATQN